MKITNSQYQHTESNVAIIILAAGESTRMGTPKQLLPYQGHNLLKHTIASAVTSVCKSVTVVLGANAQQIHSQINQDSVTVVENPDWHLGMGASIRSGILSLTNDRENVDAAIITVCDQPFLSSEIINNLVTKYYSTGKSIVACEYADTLGVPVLFNHNFFAELAALGETGGAKKLINKYCDRIFSIPFPLGAVDIDTPQDYQQLLVTSNK
ncbi:nucleotidyltransferase family protein [Calothrix rhizosoleniae]|uniref:nucleotidyltransferase family protein n=1 Tax=Calothrix rhizosoleniae TaxID=888997 RepID=UPI000B4A319C|nr:nucleotidyltransferase family protein [Calothrix rhizosoleniae]